MTDKYEIDIEPRGEDEMQIDSAAHVHRKGRGFQSEETVTVAERESTMKGEAPGHAVHAENWKIDSAGDAVRSIEGWIVLVTNVHEEATEEDLQERFAEYGEVQQLHLNLDRRTGYVKGYALVEYATLSDAKNAIENTNGSKLLDQIITTDFAFVRPRETVNGSRRRRGKSQSPGR